MDLTESTGFGELTLGPTIASDYWRDAAICASVVICVVVRFLGGSSWLVLALALLPLPYLFRRPRVALWYGLAFMPVATVAAPEDYEWFSGFTPAQMYFWALGLFIVLIPVILAIVRYLRPVGWRRIRNSGIPVPLFVLFAVSLAACLQGLRLGSPLSFVLRQFYGVLLFCLAFVATLLFVRRSDLRPALRRMSILVLSLSAYTIVFYLRDENQVGFFKGNLSLFSATLAVYCGGEFLCAGKGRGRVGWGLLGLLFLVHPVLFSSRGAVGLAGITVLAGMGLRMRSRPAKYLLVAGAFAFLAASITMNLFSGLSQLLERYSLLRHLVPIDVLADPDAVGRISQFYAAVEAIIPHPLLGLGLGSTLTWYQPALGVFQSAALVDNGWAYILSKMGAVGFLAFCWFVFSVLMQANLRRSSGLELGLWLVALFQLLMMVIGGIMLHFIYAVWAGLTWGLLSKLSRRESAGDPRSLWPAAH